MYIYIRDVYTHTVKWLYGRHVTKQPKTIIILIIHFLTCWHHWLHSWLPGKNTKQRVLNGELPTVQVSDEMVGSEHAYQIPGFQHVLVILVVVKTCKLFFLNCLDLWVVLLLKCCLRVRAREQPFGHTWAQLSTGS